MEPYVGHDEQVREARELLGLDVGASRRDIVRAWRRAIQLTHPDLADASTRTIAEALSRKLNDARDLLLSILPAEPAPTTGFGSGSDLTKSPAEVIAEIEAQLAAARAAEEAEAAAAAAAARPRTIAELASGRTGSDDTRDGTADRGAVATADRTPAATAAAGPEASTSLDEADEVAFTDAAPTAPAFAAPTPVVGPDAGLTTVAPLPPTPPSRPATRTAAAPPAPPVPPTPPVPPAAIVAVAASAPDAAITAPPAPATPIAGGNTARAATPTAGAAAGPNAVTAESLEHAWAPPAAQPTTPPAAQPTTPPAAQPTTPPGPAPVYAPMALAPVSVYAAPSTPASPGWAPGGPGPAPDPRFGVTSQYAAPRPGPGMPTGMAPGMPTGMAPGMPPGMPPGPSPISGPYAQVFTPPGSTGRTPEVAVLAPITSRPADTGAEPDDNSRATTKGRTLLNAGAVVVLVLIGVFIWRAGYAPDPTRSTATVADLGSLVRAHAVVPNPAEPSGANRPEDAVTALLQSVAEGDSAPLPHLLAPNLDAGQLAGLLDGLRAAPNGPSGIADAASQVNCRPVDGGAACTVAALGPALAKPVRVIPAEGGWRVAGTVG